MASLDTGGRRHSPRSSTPPLNTGPNRSAPGSKANSSGTRTPGSSREPSVTPSKGSENSEYRQDQKDKLDHFRTKLDQQIKFLADHVRRGKDPNLKGKALRQHNEITQDTQEDIRNYEKDIHLLEAALKRKDRLPKVHIKTPATHTETVATRALTDDEAQVALDLYTGKSGTTLLSDEAQALVDAVLAEMKTLRSSKLSKAELNAKSESARRALNKALGANPKDGNDRRLKRRLQRSLGLPTLPALRRKTKRVAGNGGGSGSRSRTNRSAMLKKLKGAQTHLERVKKGLGDTLLARFKSIPKKPKTDAEVAAIQKEVAALRRSIDVQISIFSGRVSTLKEKQQGKSKEMIPKSEQRKLRHLRRAIDELLHLSKAALHYIDIKVPPPPPRPSMPKIVMVDPENLDAKAASPRIDQESPRIISADGPKPLSAHTFRSSWAREKNQALRASGRPELNDLTDLLDLYTQTDSDTPPAPPIQRDLKELRIQIARAAKALSDAVPRPPLPIEDPNDAQKAEMQAAQNKFDEAQKEHDHLKSILQDLSAELNRYDTDHNTPYTLEELNGFAVANWTFFEDEQEIQSTLDTLQGQFTTLSLEHDTQTGEAQTQAEALLSAIQNLKNIILGNK